MPYIQVKTSQTVEDIKKTAIEKRLTESISIIPGKTSAYFMCSVEDNISFMFHGDKAPTAFVEVKLLGKSTKEAYGNLTAEICTILKEEIGVSPDYCYVKFEEVEYWGYNNFMF